MYVSQTRHLEVVNLSDVGRNRPHNEDSTATDPHWGLMLVADGMGGYRAGELASALAIAVMLRKVYLGLDRMQADGDHGGADSVEGMGSMEGCMALLRKAAEAANQTIYQISCNHEECRGMGTTIVAALFRNGKVGIAHVGDSRVYRLRGQQLEQVTKDHSLYQEVIDKGLCSPQEALEFTNKSLVTRALGVRKEVEVDVQQMDCLPGDIYLLCSDGLNDMLKDRDIHLALRRHDADLAQAGRELVALANRRGGKDNISVVLVKIIDHVEQESDEESDGARDPRPSLTEDRQPRQGRAERGRQERAAEQRPGQRWTALWQN